MPVTVGVNEEPPPSRSEEEFGHPTDAIDTEDKVIMGVGTPTSHIAVSHSLITVMGDIDVDRVRRHHLESALGMFAT